MIGELPDGWTPAALGDLGRWTGGGTPSKANRSFWANGQIPWASPKDVKGDVIADTEDHITDEAVRHSATRIVPAGSVVVVTRSGILAHSLPVAVAGQPIAINQDLRALIPADGISGRYVALALRSLAQEILAECSRSGTTVPSIVTARLLRLEIPLPPTAEQLRVVSCTDDLLDRARSITDALGRLPDLLRRLESQLLAAAFTGEVTATWRAELRTSQKPYDPLEEIKRELALFGRKVAQPRPHFEDSYHLLPETPWGIVALESACRPDRSLTYGIIQTGEHVDDGIPTVRAGDIKDFGVALDGLKKVRPEIADRHPRTQLEGGELLVSIRGTTGNVAVASESMKGMNVSREVAVVPLVTAINPHFAAYAIASPAGQAIIESHIQGIAQSGINLSDLRAFPLPVCPRAEQDELVVKVGNARLRLRHAKESSARATHAIDSIKATILRMGITGRLTDQDASEESATVLLERTRALVATGSSESKPVLREDRDESASIASRRSHQVAKTRKDVQPNYLEALINNSGRRVIDVRDLFYLSEMNVDEFYKQLAGELDSGGLTQSADKSQLELANAP